jgi:RNA polymerase sigma-70 factor (ECF subfamily)
MGPFGRLFWRFKLLGRRILNLFASLCDYNSEMTKLGLSTSDAELVSLAAKGDERALADLYQRYSEMVYNYLLRLVHERVEAEDLLQDVFLIIWQGASKYRGSAQVRTWIFKIAHNRAVSWLRRQRFNRLFHELTEEHATPGVEEQATVAWRDTQLSQAMMRLAPKHREVLELAFVYEMSYAEMAEVLSCPIGTVKSRMSYALHSLGNTLQALDPEQRALLQEVR